MTRPRAATLLTSLLACSALVAPALTSAALPKPTKPLTIKPFKQIGAVKLGMSKSQAIAKWGQPEVCALEDDTQQETCTWLEEQPPQLPPQGTAIQVSPSGDVCGIAIQAGVNLADDSMRVTALKKWKTEGGVGLGSKMSAAKKELGGKTVKKVKGVTTSFVASSVELKKVGRINIFEQDCLVT